MKSRRKKVIIIIAINLEQNYEAVCKGCKNLLSFNSKYVEERLQVYFATGFNQCLVCDLIRTLVSSVYFEYEIMQKTLSLGAPRFFK